MPDSMFGIPHPDNKRFNPDDPPAYADPMDDEFEGNALNSKWTNWNQPAGGTVTVANSHVTMVTPYNIQSRIWALTQPAPSGNWRVRAKCAFDCATWNFLAVGLVARRQAGTDQSLFLGSMFHSTYGAPTFWGERLAGTAFVSEVDVYNISSNIFYMEMEYDGTNITFRASATGVAYSRAYLLAVATYPGSAPDNIGIALHNWSNFTSDPNWGGTLSFDWFRRVA